jgi:hypothetical protein
MSDINKLVEIQDYAKRLTYGVPHLCDDLLILYQKIHELGNELRCNFPNETEQMFQPEYSYQPVSKQEIHKLDIDEINNYMRNVSDVFTSSNISQNNNIPITISPQNNNAPITTLPQNNDIDAPITINSLRENENSTMFNLSNDKNIEKYSIPQSTKDIIQTITNKFQKQKEELDIKTFELKICEEELKKNKEKYDKEIQQLKNTIMEKDKFFAVFKKEAEETVEEVIKQLLIFRRLLLSKNGLKQEVHYTDRSPTGYFWSCLGETWEKTPRKFYP